MTGFPRYLYRYRSLSDKSQVIQELDALQNSFLWFSSFATLNDPAELADADTKRVPILADCVLRLMLKDPKGRIAKVMNNRAKYLASGWMDKDISGVCCFSEKGDHQAMWAYYAGNFTGICVRYDMHKLLALNEFCWGNKPLKVIYDDERLVSAKNTIDFGSNTSEGKKALSTKHPDWMHEQEWRLLKRNEFGKTYHTANAIAEVILGARVCSKTAKQLENICEKQRIAISRALFYGHVMVVEPVKIKMRASKAELSFFTEEAKKQCQNIISKGYDRRSLKLAVKTARKYPDAKSVFLVSLGDEAECLYIYILFELANGKENTKRLRFEINNSKIDRKFTYSL